MKPIAYSRSATRTLRRIPANVSAQIVGKINAYARDPSSQANNVRALAGTKGIRLRVGDWRVIMEDDVVLAVLKIGPRDGIFD